jgi:hypothetical protein
VLEVNLKAYATFLGLNASTPVGSLPAIGASITYTPGCNGFLVTIPAIIVAGLVVIVAGARKQRQGR